MLRKMIKVALIALANLPEPEKRPQQRVRTRGPMRHRVSGMPHQKYGQDRKDA